MDYATIYLGKDVKVMVDRPLGSRHPKYDLVYLVNYGFVPNTKAPDEDDKLVVVPKNISYSDEQIKALTEFQEKLFESEIIRWK